LAHDGIPISAAYDACILCLSSYGSSDEQHQNRTVQQQAIDPRGEGINSQTRLKRRTAMNWIELKSELILKLAVCLTMISTLGCIGGAVHCLASVMAALPGFSRRTMERIPPSSSSPDRHPETWRRY